VSKSKGKGPAVCFYRQALGLQPEAAERTTWSAAKSIAASQSLTMFFREWGCVWRAARGRRWRRWCCAVCSSDGAVQAKDQSRIAPNDPLQIDACWSISAGLAMVDPIRAAAFNVRQLLRALEAGFSAVAARAGSRRSEEFSRRARALAEREGDRYVAALTSLWAGVAPFLTGQWKKAASSAGSWHRASFTRSRTTCRDFCDRRGTWQLMESRQAPLRRSLFLRVQHTRLEASYFHARCALAMAALGFDARGMAAVASRDAQRIERENMPWSSPFARLIRATVAYQEGNVERAVEGLTAATEGFSAAHMQLYAAGCRRRLSAIVRGGWGHSLRRDADQWMAAQDIPNGAAMTRMVAPGFPD
jgi:hypothetical protein